MRRQDFEHRPTLIRADEPVGRALPLDQAADQHALCGPYRDDLPPIGVGPDAELGGFAIPTWIDRPATCGRRAVATKPAPWPQGRPRWIPVYESLCFGMKGVPQRAHGRDAICAFST
jgi:hypothetical protein